MGGRSLYNALVPVFIKESNHARTRSFKASMPKRISLKEIAEKVCNKSGINSESIRWHSKQKEISSARRIFCYLANKYCQHRVSDIARYLDITQTAVSKTIQRCNLSNREADEFLVK